MKMAQGCSKGGVGWGAQAFASCGFTCVREESIDLTWLFAAPVPGVLPSAWPCRQCELDNATLHRDLSAALEKVLNHKLALQVCRGAWVCVLPIC